MEIQGQLILLIMVWGIAVSAVMFRSWGKFDQSSGFTMIYVANLAMIHWLCAFVYLFPGNWYVNGNWMLLGFRESTLAIVGFAVGNLFLTPVFMNFLRIPVTESVTSSETFDRGQQAKLAYRYFRIGIIAYFLVPFLGQLPTVRALVYGVEQFVVIGVCLMCWVAWRDNDRPKFRKWILISLFFPFMTITLYGYLGYGTAMLLIVLFFVARFFKPKWKMLLTGFFLSFFFLSLYQTYMRDRGKLRDIIWSDVSLSTRVKAVQDTLSSPEWFNPSKLEHLERVESRMNQNVLVGAAVEYIDAKRVEHANGSTFLEAFIALVPRIVWPAKPVYAGSPGIVSKYTGMTFDPNTAVGVGQVMECYINFGHAGVVIGFMIIGAIVAVIDIVAGRYLLQGDLHRFVLWFFPGTALLMVGDAFVEVTAGAGASFTAAYFIDSKYNIFFYGVAAIYALFQAMAKYM